MTDTADLLKRARWSYGEAVKLFERGKAYKLPRAVAYGREALRDYLRAALVKGGHSISSSSLIELAEDLVGAKHRLSLIEGTGNALHDRGCTRVVWAASAADRYRHG